MNDQEFKERMIGHMATQSANMKNMDGWMKKLDGNVDEMKTDVEVLKQSGCVVGVKTGARLTALENSPRKSAVGGAVSGGGIAAVFITVVEAIKFVLGRHVT